MTSRREAVKRLAGLAAAGRMTSLHDMFGTDAAVARPGLQLYTVRAEMQKSVEATLTQVAKIGYREVEFAGYFGTAPSRIARLLQEHRLTAPASHVSIDVARTAWDQALDDAAAAGHQYLVVPSLDARERTSIDDYRRHADTFNTAAEAAQKRGLRFAYHNHDYEFIPIGGEVPYDVLLARCDPALVFFELDLFWITKAGHDPLEYFTRHRGRFPMVHVKDMMRDGTMTEVGRGAIPFSRIFARGEEAGLRHYFVEHDNPADPFDSIAVSYKALRAL